MYAPTDYRHTDKHLRLVIGQMVQLWEHQHTNGRTVGQMDATKCIISLASRLIIMSDNWGKCHYSHIGGQPLIIWGQKVSRKMKPEAHREKKLRRWKSSPLLLPWLYINLGNKDMRLLAWYILLTLTLLKYGSGKSTHGWFDRRLSELLHATSFFFFCICWHVLRFYWLGAE